MDLSSLSSPLDSLRSGRFLVVGYLPAAAATVFVLILVWAGAPVWWRHEGVSLKAAWKVATSLGAGEIVLLVLAVTLVAAVLVPLQRALMRVLAGSWPAFLGGGLGLWWQGKRKQRLLDAATLPQDRAQLTEAAVIAAGRAESQLHRRYARPEHLLRPTALGNALAALEDAAGSDYGLDAVVAWPRLYPVLGEAMRAVVNDRRDIMDSAGRMVVTAAVTTVAFAVLLWGSGWWLLLALVPAVLTVVSYTGAVAAAVAYGETVRSAFDLHRFDLLTAQRLPLPTSRREERELNEALCGMWRQGFPMTQNYRTGS